MEKFMLVCLFLCYAFLSAAVINVPAEQPSIQAGIDVAHDADTVLVQRGCYYENLNYSGKNITVASLFLINGNPENISETVISSVDNESTVKFENNENNGAVLCGFTIRDGYTSNDGAGIYINNSSPVLRDLIIKDNFSENCGGGICCHYYSNPVIINVILHENESFNGGGIYILEDNDVTLSNVKIFENTAVYGAGICKGSLGGYPSSLNLLNVTIKNNAAQNEGGGILWSGSEIHFSNSSRCNIFNNSAGCQYGNDLQFYYLYNNEVNVIVDTFTVMYPTETQASPIENFAFDIKHPHPDNTINADVYVSTSGNDSNSGLSPQTPFLTIKKALSVIYADSLNRNNIFLAPGIYSSSNTGETFPINFYSSYINLAGDKLQHSILDAENNSRVLNLNNISIVGIKNICIINGYSDTAGGGVFMNNAIAEFEKVAVCDNLSQYGGSGIHLTKTSSADLLNCSFWGNYSSENGAAIYNYSDFDVVLENCICWGNEPQQLHDAAGSYGQVIVTYSDIEDGWQGNGNINLPPLMADPLAGDYRITWENFPVADETKSPCIDAGNPNSGLDFDGTTADLGITPFFQHLLGDVNNDYYIDAFDASLVLQYFCMVEPAEISLPWEAWRISIADVDGNNVIEAFDASLIMQYYLGFITTFPVED